MVLSFLSVFGCQLSTGGSTSATSGEQQDSAPRVSTKRLKELEVRATFQEDTIEKLSKELSIQQKEIILLKEELKSLKESHEKNIIEDTGERPPHY